MSTIGAVTITSQLRLGPDDAQALRAGGHDMLAGMQVFPGFRSIRIVQHKDDPGRMLFVETWQSEEAYREYLVSRISSGEIDAVGEISAEAEVDAWPKVLAVAGRPDAIADPDGVTVTFDLQVEPQHLPQMLGEAGLFEAARASPGLRGVRIVQHRDDPAHLLLVEQWDSEADFQGYAQSSAGRDEMDGVMRLAAHAETDVWPKLVARA